MVLEEKEMVTKYKKEKIYHRKCLSCSHCSKPILGKFFKIGGAVVCHSCARKEVRIAFITTMN